MNIRSPGHFIFAQISYYQFLAVKFVRLFDASSQDGMTFSGIGSHDYH
jgi:hypothetical protein